VQLVKSGNNLILFVAFEIGFFRLEKFVAHVFGFIDG